MSISGKDRELFEQNLDFLRTSDSLQRPCCLPPRPPAGARQRPPGAARAPCGVCIAPVERQTIAAAVVGASTTTGACQGWLRHRSAPSRGSVGSWPRFQRSSAAKRVRVPPARRRWPVRVATKSVRCVVRPSRSRFGASPGSWAGVGFVREPQRRPPMPLVCGQGGFVHAGPVEQVLHSVGEPWPACSARVQPFLRVSGVRRARIRSQAVVRVSGRGRCGLVAVSVNSFSRHGHGRAATLMAAATASECGVFTTIDDRAVAVVVSEERPDQQGAVSPT